MNFNIFPDRKDIQKSRQKWFRYVTWASGGICGSSCTKRILCEQSCKDGLNGPAMSDYPQVLDGDTEADKEYVQAYKEGENQACYQPTSKEHPYDGKACETDCQKKYPDCDNDMDKSYLTIACYESARLFHKLGLWTFSAIWKIDDILVAAKNKSIKTGQAIKQGFSRLYDRMVRMDNAYIEWKLGNRRRRRSTDSTDEKLWNQFLIVYNKTDSSLVEIVHESLNYNQFSNAVRSINETLSTYDFGPDNLVSGMNGITKINPYSVFLFFFITSSFILSY